MSKGKFCAICEGRLTKRDLEHVCVSCFQKAREQKKVNIHLSDQGAERLGTMLAIGSLISWGFQRMVEASGAKMPPPPKTPEEAARLHLEAQAKLRELTKRIRKHNQKGGQ